MEAAGAPLSRQPEHPLRDDAALHLAGAARDGETAVVEHAIGPAGAIRLVGATLFEQHDEWTVQHRRYMPLESLAQLSDNPIVGLVRLTAPAQAGSAR